MKKLEAELSEFVNRIYKKIKNKPLEKIKWRNDLNSIIKEIMDVIAKEYSLNNQEKNKLIRKLNHRAIERISDSRSQKHLNLDKSKLKTTEDRVGVLLGDESFDELNEEETTELLWEDFFSPLIEELELKKNNKKLSVEQIELKKFRDVHTNKGGKAWRDDLYALAKNELIINKSIDGIKTLSLKAGFEKMPDKESHRAEFDLKFNSIYQTYLKKV